MTELPPEAPLRRPLPLPSMPPTLHDIDRPSVSEIIPFRSSKINIVKSGILIPFGVTALASVLLFSLSNFVEIMYVLAGYMLFCFFYAAYIYSGIKKPVLIYLVPCAILYVEMTTPILSGFIYVFRTILPGSNPKDPNFFNVFFSMFFGAGLMEELMKAVPALIGLWLATRPPNPSQPSNRYVDLLRCSNPLEGLLLGLASGACFIFVETLFQYVPETVAEVTKTSGVGAGFANGFALLFPRVMHGVIGHMAWAGISGYFIGLSARYPGLMPKILAIGWLVPALLHALWNSSGNLGEIGHWIAGSLSLLTFVGCFLKAKQLEAVRQGTSFVPTDSIIVGTASVALAHGTSPERQAAAWVGLSQIVDGLFRPKAASPGPRVADTGTEMPGQPAVMGAPAVAAIPCFTLGNGAHRYAIAPGQTIDLATLFPGKLPPGSLAAVTVHPQDPSAIGLKNMTSEVWTVALDTGVTTTVAAGRNVKLVPNEKIGIGSFVIDVKAI